MSKRYEVVTTIHFCFAHRLQSHGGECKRLHGHNAKVMITYEANDLELSSGMVIDFRVVKNRALSWIDENWDHRTILQVADPLADHIEKYDGGTVFLLPGGPPTTENMAAHLYEVLRSFDNPGVDAIGVASVTLWETPKQFVKYTGA